MDSLENAPLLPSARDTPEAYVGLMKQIFWLSIPAALSFALEYTPTLVALHFVGGLPGDLRLSGTGLALTWLNVLTTTGSGVLNAMSTLVPQAIGDNNPRMAAATLQRGLLLGMIVSVFVCALTLPLPWLLGLIGQAPAVASDAGVFAQWSMVGMPGVFLYFAVTGYLHGLNIWWATIPAAVVSNGVQFGLSYWLSSSNGLAGISIAMSLQRHVLLALCVIVMLWGGYYKQAWFGWSWRDTFNLAGLRVFLSLGLPAAITVCADVIGYEILTVMASFISEEALSAMSLVSQVYICFWMLFLGISGEAAYLVGVHIGAREPRKARRAAIAVLLTSFLCSIVTGSGMFLASDVLAAAFTSDPIVRKLAARSFRFAAGVHVIDVFQCACGGVLLGIGLQTRASLINLLGYFVVSAPVAYLLAFTAGMGLDGIWLGLLSAVVTMSACHIFHIVTHVDWSAYCDEAVKRSQDERSRHEAGPHYQLVACNAGGVDDTVLVLVASGDSSDVSSGSDE